MPPVPAGGFPKSPADLFAAMPHVYDRTAAEGWAGSFYFELAHRGETTKAYVFIDDGDLEVRSGWGGSPDVSVATDWDTWVDVMTGRSNPLWLVLRGRIRVSGKRLLMDKFGKCFPKLPAEAVARQ